MRHPLSLLMLASLILLPQLAAADNCPHPRDIVRTPGENSWFSNKPGWEGGFYSPMQGIGHSTHISHLTQAQWVQVTNMENGLGYIICDYKGNYDSETVRFTQIREDITKRPKGTIWSCQIKLDYPSTACTCSGAVGDCGF